MTDAQESAKRFADNWSKPKPDTDAYAALVHAFETGYSRGHKRAIEHLVSAMTKLLEPEVMEFIEKSIVRKGLKTGVWKIFTDSEEEDKK